jgi:hypothetical protein
MTTRFRPTPVVVALAAVLALSGCTQVVNGAGQRVSNASAGLSACTKVDAPLKDVNTHSTTEPKLRVPQPTDWETVPKMTRGLIRFVMTNPRLTGNMFASNVVVTLEKTNYFDAQTIFADQRKLLVRRGKVSDLNSQPSTVCGLPADLISFRGPRMLGRGQRAVTTLAVVAPVGNKQYLVTATAQTADPDNAVYRKDIKTIFDGLQVLAPST